MSGSPVPRVEADRFALLVAAMTPAPHSFERAVAVAQALFARRVQQRAGLQRWFALREVADVRVLSREALAAASLRAAGALLLGAHFQPEEFAHLGRLAASGGLNPVPGSSYS